jgi:3-phosphoshikimate 1-carboxyvinyltransferase
MADGMRILGISVDETPDGATVHGGRVSGGIVQSCGDHRVAMSLALAGTIASDEVIVDDVAAVDTSFPGFRDVMAAFGAEISVSDEN